MRGVITGLKSHASCFYFITGEDGKQYYSRPGFLAVKQAWDKYVWNGNGCEFDTEPSEKGKTDVARNVVPDRVLDPNFAVRKSNRLENRKRAEENAAIRAKNRKKNELLKAEADRLAAVKKQYKTYLVQGRFNGVWRTMMLDDKELAYDTVEEAKNAVKELKRMDHYTQFRVRDRWKELNRRGDEEQY